MLVKEVNSLVPGDEIAQPVQRLGYGLDDRGSIPVRVIYEIFLFATASRPNLRST
jgi:hypothetical protein